LKPRAAKTLKAKNVLWFQFVITREIKRGELEKVLAKGQ
jgi:hypothetical protein